MAAPLSGALGADFSKFDTAVQQSVVNLRGFETGAAKVEKSLDRVTNSLSGTKIIQEATIAAAAVERVGGVSTLTARELGRVQATAQEAAEKLRALGQDVPPGIDRLARSLDDVGGAAARTGPKVNDLRGTMSQFDGVLAAAGVNVGPEIRALGDLGDVSGKSAKDIGLLATAGLAFGAAAAGWKVGRLVAEFFDLDVKIGNATAKLLGWGDVAGQVAGAKQDVINLAITRGAAATVSYTDALQFNADWLTRSKAAALGSAVAATADGDAKAAAAEKIKAATAKADAAMAASAARLRAVQDQIFGRDLMTRAQEYVTAIGPLSNLTKVSAEEQGRLNTAVEAGIAAFSRHGQVAPQAMRDLAMATMQLPPIVSGIDNLIGKLGTTHAMVVPKMTADTKAGADAWAAYNEETQRAAAEGIGSVVTAFGQSAAAAQVGATAVNGFSIALQGMSAEAAAAWASMSQGEQIMSRLQGRLAAIQAYRDAGIFVNMPLAGNGIASDPYIAAGRESMRSFARGGSGDFGSGTPVMLHGKEAIIPLGSGGGGASGQALNITVNVSGGGGDARAQGDQIADALVSALRRKGVRLGA